MQIVGFPMRQLIYALLREKNIYTGSKYYEEKQSSYKIFFLSLSISSSFGGGASISGKMAQIPKVVCFPTFLLLSLIFQ